MARSRTATVSDLDTDYRTIKAEYRKDLDQIPPPADLVWEPVKIGPTWQWDDGWAAPRLTLGWGVLAWCTRWLRDKGDPWWFTPEQARLILWFYAVDEAGDWVYHSGVFQRLKGWGKDPVAACLSAASAFGPVSFDRFVDDQPVGHDESDAWVQVVAVSLEQTKNTMKCFPGLLSDPETRKWFGVQVGKENIYGLGDTRQIQAVTASPSAIEGGRPTLVVRNETQNWTTGNGGHDMAGAIEGNIAKAEGGRARMLDICNAYRPGEDSVAERVREGWEATQGDTPRALNFGLLYDSLEAPPDAPLTAEAAPDVVRSIAGDSSWLDTRKSGRIVKSILNPANPASESRRKWYNQITATEDAWVVPQDFDMCADKRTVDLGSRITMFFDGSKSDDATALVGCRESDGYVFTIGVWQRPPHVDSWLVDRADVDRRVNEAFTLWRPVAFFGDPSDARDDETGERYWEPYLDGWGRRFGDRLEMWAVKEGDRRHAVIWDMRYPRHQATFVEHAERFTSDVVGQTIVHDGSALLTQHVRNARRRPNKFGVSLGKEHRESSRKVDAAVAAVGARMMWRLLAARPAKDQHDGGWWA